MAYFPFYIDIKDKNFLVVGGGNVALRKIEKLLPFEPDITVIAPVICDEIRKLDVIILEREFSENYLDGKFCVISATDDEEVNENIFRLCTERNILVNTVDDRDKCGFIFPALAQKNGVTVGITTEGKSPVYAKYLRKQIEELLEKSNPDIAETLSKYRGQIKAKINQEENRKAVFEKLLVSGLSGTKITDSLVSEIIEEINSYEN